MAAPPQVRVIEVAPNGPVPSLAAALEQARAMPDGPKTIRLAAGDYLEQSVTLGARDSGLTVEGAGQGETVLYGGRRLTGWRPDGDGLMAVDLPEVKDGRWDFRMLVVNGRYAPRARLPREATFSNLNQWDVPWMSTTGGGWKRKPTPEELTTLLFAPEDLGPWLAIKNAEVTVYHSWDESVVGIAAIDHEAHKLTFSTSCGHPPGSFGHHEYVVWNVREGLTDPGQWYLDRTAGKLVYRPLAGEDMATAEVLAPTTETIVRIQGTAEAPAKDIALRGLTLSVTGTPLKAGGFGANVFNGAVTVTEAVDCACADLEIANVGGQGIKTWKTSGFRVERCRVHHTGACGIIVRESPATIVDNTVHDVGLSYPSAIAVWGGGKGEQGSLIAHNLIHHTSYTAIACGGENHRIEANRIHHAMQVMHDGAAIYITFCKNITVRGNYASDIAYQQGGQAHAYYLDEQAEDCLVEDNLAVRCPSPHLSHMAKHNTLRHNVFVSDGDLVCRFPKSSGYRFEGNVLVAGETISILGPEAIDDFAHNVLFSRSGKLVGRPLTNYHAGDPTTLELRGASVAEDPKLVLEEIGRVTYGPDSPATRLGLAPLDVSAAGPR